MSRKILSQISVFALLLLTFLAIPTGAQAGGICGGTYIVDAGDTLNSLAARCGTNVSSITTANPGVTDPLRAGQTLTLPGSSPSGSGVTSSIVTSDTPNYNTYNTSTSTSSSTSSPSTTVTYSNGTYIIQYGDTFSAIASRYGLSVNQLWAANPQIWNINYVYAGQLIYIPTTGGYTSADTSKPLSYGTVPTGAAYSAVRLVNKSSSKDIYVSLQGVTRDSVNVVYEYSVRGSLDVKVPAGNYTYVTWANGQKFVGNFHLPKDSDRVLTFYNDKSAVE
jgi:LysM repeat protein